MLKEMNPISSFLKDKIGIDADKIHYQLPPEQLQKMVTKSGMGKESREGVLMINTGEFTGRSPKDRYIVLDDFTRDKVNWGAINISVSSDEFSLLYKDVTAYLKGTLYVRDCYACADDRFRMPIRVINELPWSNLFVYNMFLRPKFEELEAFMPDWTVINAPGFKADPNVHNIRAANFTIINIKEKIIVIGGTGYTGEIKKAIFSVLNLLLPLNHQVLPMHCSANIGEFGDTALFFGLSGTGKTTLSSVANRKIIGDDEHGWSDAGVFNFEGGCYAKVINLSAENEPEIFNAVRKGALLENVMTDVKDEIDYKDTSITQNTRVSYPINFLKKVQFPSIGGNPKNVFFLTADAFGVLPPLSRLNLNQAAYYFISGYTAKVAGTECGITEPQPSFSACFGAPFLPLNPVKYAAMLQDKLCQNQVKVWLVNTGWTGGVYGVGKRIPLKYTRAMINAVLDGDMDELTEENYRIHPVFKLSMPLSCNDIPENIMNPCHSWNNIEEYYRVARNLAQEFHKNFRKFKGVVDEAIYQAGPEL
ncbi:phosphoenolpyruvate carboxykinase (ATP) [Robertkochia solimangrovi]|uniref:phosphoenolpyruvate carboxykinase (ATP) n=1 Tax=Robertkochia solimangrovi TaxID=2213046 RepID=UPI00117E13DA|nr:phosphoenolpyruvate carboxykinase (ATP) [Robertkochia solimangrovi]TRZ43551.1 phosphoenolpyruvate carboxykinase (ATP) [Robertkochia solimangrovi]